METGLSLGSNLGDRLSHLREARRRIGELPGVVLVDAGGVYETAPVGVRAAYADMAFLNSVLIVETEIPPGELGELLRRIEAEMGRVRSDDRNAPRPIDIDVLFAGALMLDDEAMTVPHPRWCERRFVVQPLADVRPELVLPGFEDSVSVILAGLPMAPAVAQLARDW
jgi:2-amino-4-hydroxy-6-hydroxymethyldihydropteridine diphosphokinase